MHKLENTNNKIFVIGLPRTGTTSISVALLNLGFTVAHTAFTKETFSLADAISDAPCFSDFEQLDHLFPGAKFIYLQRDLATWLPSIRRLLIKMQQNLQPKVGTFSPVLKRAMEEIFHLDSDDLLSDEHLTACYLTHLSHVKNYFKYRKDLLMIDISNSTSYQEMVRFLALQDDGNQTFPHLNTGEQVAGWKAYKHINKISSHSAGKDHRQFFDYKKEVTH